MENHKTDNVILVVISPKLEILWISWFGFEQADLHMNVLELDFSSTIGQDI